MKKVAPRSTPHLRRMNFELVTLSDHPQQGDNGPWHFLDAILRHPAALVVLSFFFTGLLAQHLTHNQELVNAKREVASKREAAIRESLDGLVTAYSGYLVRTIRVLEEPRTTRGLDETTQNFRNYDGAYLKWRESLATGLPTIKSSIEDDDDTVFQAALFIEISSAILDECVRTSFLEPTVSPLRGKSSTTITCQNRFDASLPLNLYEWLDSLSRCVFTAGVQLRPDARRDERYTVRAGIALGHSCDLGALPTRLMPNQVRP